MTAAACPGCAVAAPAALARADAPDATLLSLPTIHCAGCIGTVERTLRALPGVTSARVNLSLKRVSVDAPGLEPARLIDALAQAGYPAQELSPEVLGRSNDALGDDLLLRLAVAGFAMMNVMLISVGVWSGAAGITRDFFHLISAAITLPVVAYSGQPFFGSAMAALRGGRLNMDVPISLAILLAAAMSLYETLHGGAHAYFDAALSLTFFLLIGRFLDHKTRAAARSAAAELAALESQTAERLEQGRRVTVPVAALAVGDRVQVATGARVPVDGRIEADDARLDTSMLTGESAPATRLRGDAVAAGEINLGAPLVLTATAVGSDTTLRRMAAMVDLAESARSRYTSLADRAAAIYAPAVHLLALAAFIGWAVATGDARLALNIAIAVLIITCPCALGLAVPAVSTAAIGRLYRAGVLVKDGTALERLAEVDTVVFDKTGTLTAPRLELDTTALSPRQKAVALALAQASDHPVAQAVARGLGDVPPAALSGIKEVPGQGMCAAGASLGSARLTGADGDGTWLRIGTDAPVRLPLAEALRPGAEQAVAELRKAGLDLWIASGDRDGAVVEVASRLGIANRLGQARPEDKIALLEQLSARGHRVLMVGDGLNDAASLAAAHASAAPGSALDAARVAADMVLLGETLGALPQALVTARKAVRLSRQNFAIAAAYNMIAVPIALAGFATPLLAALAMSTSSITVLANALRVRTNR